MPKGYRKNGSKLGFQLGHHFGFQKGNHPSYEFKKGLVPWNKGIKTGLNPRLSLIMTGRSPSIATRKKLSKSGLGKNKGKKRPDLAKWNKINIKRGKESGNWKGGITKLTIAIRNSFKYRQWRSDVYMRDFWTCQDCFLKGGKLEAHHKDTFSDIMKRNCIQTLQEAFDCEELWNIDNGVTLCVKCHDRCHGKIT